jgi:hypothetical protein
MTCLVARSISRTVQVDLFSEQAATWHVLGVFDRACNLATPAGDVVAVVLPDVGDGPLNVVLDAADAYGEPVRPGAFRALVPGMVAGRDDEVLRIGGMAVTLAHAEAWEPCPEWRSLRAHHSRVARRLPLVSRHAARHAPPGSLLSLVRRRAVSGPALGSEPATRRARTTKAVAHNAAETLQAGWDPANSGLLQAAARQLAGLGVGLTPAGDDFLAGVMLWAWLAHPSPPVFCRSLLNGAAPHTTTLAAAFLRAAARGECTEPWHHLLTALAREKEDEMEAAVERVVARGHTSGADTLAGFLWLACK